MDHDHEDAPTTRDICDRIGRKLVADRIGVSKKAVSNAVAEGVFPARWYRELRAVCSEQGIECPEDLFNFARAPSTEEEGKADDPGVEAAA